MASVTDSFTDSFTDQFTDSVTSIWFGCNWDYLGTLATEQCWSEIATIIPTCEVSDLACCSSAYSFENVEATCLAKYATCLDLPGWQSDITSRSKLCTSDVADITGSIDWSTVTATGASGSSATGSSSAGASVTSKPTSGASVTGTVHSASASATSKSGANKVRGELRTSVVLGAVGVFALLAFHGGI